MENHEEIFKRNDSTSALAELLGITSEQEIRRFRTSVAQVRLRNKNMAESQEGEDFFDEVEV